MFITEVDEPSTTQARVGVAHSWNPGDVEQQEGPQAATQEIAAYVCGRRYASPKKRHYVNIQTCACSTIMFGVLEQPRTKSLNVHVYARVKIINVHVNI